MNINTELLEQIKDAKELRQAPLSTHNGIISLADWFGYIKNAPRVADKKEADSYKQRLTEKGIL